MKSMNHWQMKSMNHNVTKQTATSAEKFFEVKHTIDKKYFKVKNFRETKFRDFAFFWQILQNDPDKKSYYAHTKGVCKDF